VTVCQKPAITQQTLSQTVTANSSQSMTVTATGTELHYQWYRGAAGNVSTPVGTDSSTYTATVASTVDYWVRVSGKCGASANGQTIRFSVVPVITTQPAGAAITSGTPHTMTVAATGTYLTYQWYSGAAPGTLISGATAASYTTPALTAAGSYWCRVTSGAASADSATATVTICQPRTITMTNETQIAGDPVYLGVTGGAQANETYEWYEGDSGITTKRIAVDVAATVRPTQTTKYWLRTIRAGCTADSPSVNVRVCYPAITVQPQGGMINSGSSKTLTVTAIGPAGLTYQWYTGASGTTTSPVSGATSSSYAASPSTDTSYWVQVRSTGGCVINGQAALVTVCQPASITQHPVPTSVTKGSTVTLYVTATGTSLSYQWYRGAAGVTTTPICGNAASCSEAVTTTTDYWVRVTGASCGTPADSTTTRVSVAPTITGQPAGSAITSGTSASLSVTATGTFLTYQWYAGTGTSGKITGATSATYVTPALTADASYWCRVSSGSAYADSAAATVTICQPRTISVTNETHVAGAPVNLGIAGGAQANELYEWYAGESGVTTNRISTSVATTVNPTQTTKYWLRTLRATCNADSPAVTVSVCTPSITAQPQGGTINPAPSVTLGVTAIGPQPLTYQWYIGTSGTTTSPVSGATAATYTATPAADTWYWVQVRSVNGCTANSQAALVTVCMPAAITTAPASRIAVAGTQELTVAATGTNLSYQWYRGASGNTSTPICTNAATCSVSISGTTSYWVRVSASCGNAVNSPTATLSVYPVITSQPADVSICANQSTTFSVTATGTGLTYQWYRGNFNDYSQPIAGATGTSVTIAPSVTQAVWCDVRSGDALKGTRTATATVSPGPAALSPSKTFTSGCYKLTARVSSVDEGLVEYQWYQGAIGDTSDFLTITPTTTVCPSTTTTYWVRIRYSDGTGCWTDKAVTVP
jgi:hypothetical protein